MAEEMDRLDLTRRVLAHLTDEAVFAGIGNAGFDLFAAADRPQNFYMFGSMGLASSMGLGTHSPGLMSAWSCWRARGAC